MAASRLLLATAACVILLLSRHVDCLHADGAGSRLTMFYRTSQQQTDVSVRLHKSTHVSAVFLRIHVDWHYSYVTRSQRTAQLLLCRTCKTYQLTLSAYCRSTSLRTARAFAMALAAYDWRVWKDRAASFLRAHPGEVALQLTWGQRLVVPGAREAYAVATYEREAMGRSLGAAPCNLCGCWTHSWCEACKTRPPTAICSTCDAAKLLCQSCTSCHQLVYSEASQKPN